MQKAIGKGTGVSGALTYTRNPKHFWKQFSWSRSLGFEGKKLKFRAFSLRVQNFWNWIWSFRPTLWICTWKLHTLILTMQYLGNVTWIAQSVFLSELFFRHTKRQKVKFALQFSPWPQTLSRHLKLSTQMFVNRLFCSSGSAFLSKVDLGFTSHCGSFYFRSSKIPCWLQNKDVWGQLFVPRPQRIFQGLNALSGCNRLNAKFQAAKNYLMTINFVSEKTVDSGNTIKDPFMPSISAEGCVHTSRKRTWWHKKQKAMNTQLDKYDTIQSAEKFVLTLQF